MHSTELYLKGAVQLFTIYSKIARTGVKVGNTKRLFCSESRGEYQSKSSPDHSSGAL